MMRYTGGPPRLCERCGGLLHMALVTAGYATHPTCDWNETPWRWKRRLDGQQGGAGEARTPGQVPVVRAGRGAAVHKRADSPEPVRARASAAPPVTHARSR